MENGKLKIARAHYQLSIINCQLIGFLILISSSFSYAQQWPWDYWHDGKVILDTGDTLRGKIKYSITDDIIQLDQNIGKYKSFTSKNVLTFEIFDVTVNRYRNFYSVPYSFSGGYKTPIFFELLSEGNLTLLSREKLEVRNSTNSYYGYSYYPYGSYARQILVYQYFVLNEKGQLDTFSGHKNDMLDLMSKRDDEVRKFIKENKLNLQHKYDLARAFEYYNSLFGKS